MLPATVSVAVRVRLPAVMSVALKVPIPAASVLAGGRVAPVSLLENRTVPP